MKNADQNEMSEANESVVRRLGSERAQMGAMELDLMKTRVMARARTRQPKGAALRGRIVVALLALGLMGAGAGGVMAGGGPLALGAGIADAPLVAMLVAQEALHLGGQGVGTGQHGGVLDRVRPAQLSACPLHIREGQPS